MMKALKIFFIFYFLTVFGEAMASENIIINTEANNEFSVELIYTPTTGYSWKFIDQKQESITVLGEKLENVSETSLIGGQKIKVFTFLIKEKGSYSLEFEFKRPWESKSKRTTQRTVVVN